jgi:hypothetical protein
MKIYILKTRGTARIQDYVQIRDQDFILSSHFTVADIETALGKNGLAKYRERLRKIIDVLPYGELKQFDL